MKNRLKILPFLQKALATTLCLNLFAPNVRAVDFSSMVSAPQAGAPLSVGSEFISGNYPGAILIPVNLWGSVQKSGIHHIPTKTDLLTLIALAGGPTADSEIEKVIIKRSSGKKEEIIKVDVQELLLTPGLRGPVLEANDIVVFPREKPLVGSNTLTLLSFVGGVLGIILASVALSNQVKH